MRLPLAAYDTGAGASDPKTNKQTNPIILPKKVFNLSTKLCMNERLICLKSRKKINEKNLILVNHAFDRSGVGIITHQYRSLNHIQM